VKEDLSAGLHTKTTRPFFTEFVAKVTNDSNTFCVNANRVALRLRSGYSNVIVRPTVKRGRQ